MRRIHIHSVPLGMPMAKSAALTLFMMGVRYCGLRVSKGVNRIVGALGERAKNYRTGKGGVVPSGFFMATCLSRF